MSVHKLHNLSWKHGKTSLEFIIIQQTLIYLVAKSLLSLTSSDFLEFRYLQIFTLTSLWAEY